MIIPNSPAAPISTINYLRCIVEKQELIHFEFLTRFGTHAILLLIQVAQRINKS